MTHGDGKCKIFFSGYGIFVQDLRYFGENRRETVHNSKPETIFHHLLTTFVVKDCLKRELFRPKQEGLK